MTECQAETQGWGMLPSAQTDLWDETLLRTAARAFRAWRHAVAQVPLGGCSFITRNSFGQEIAHQLHISHRISFQLQFYISCFMTHVIVYAMYMFVST